MILPDVSIIGMDDEVPADRVVIVLDIIRAFTTAAIAFERGATEIVCVPSPAAARNLRPQLPDHLVIGEQGGLKPADFDLGNSPHEMATADVEGRRLIQATTNGTRGLARATAPAAILAASAVNAGATARWIAANFSGAPVVILCTDSGAAEDPACAEYLRGLLLGTSPDPEVLVAGIKEGALDHEARTAGYPVDEQVDITLGVPYCCEVDRAGFAMVGRLGAGTVRLTPVKA